MRTDVTLLGISGNSLRWLRRLAPWSIVPLILGGLVFATVALGSMQSHGAMAQKAEAYSAARYGSDALQTIVQGPGLPQTYNVRLGDHISVLPEQGWSSITLKGTAIQEIGRGYIAVQPGKAVLESHNGAATWKYTIVVQGPPRTH